MSTIAEKIKVMQAFAKGKTILARDRATGELVKAGDPSWNWGAFEYLIEGQKKKQFFLCYSNGKELLYFPSDTMAPGNLKRVPAGDKFEEEKA